jgi:polyisoprenoid-binding protein YceI
MPTSTPPPGSLSASDLAALWQSAGGRWVLDPRASRAQFHVRHFWGAITVNGWFERISGEGTVGSDGMVSGRLIIDARSLDTANRQRDKHLRSEDFFDVERHPEVVVTVTEAGPLAGTIVRCRGTLDAAGHEEPLEFTASVQDATAGAVTLRAEVVLERTRFGMTWSPLGMAARQARAEVTARFVRQ